MEKSYIKISCPACDQHIEIPTELMEQSVVCPNCSQPFIVPKPVKSPKWTLAGWIAGMIKLTSSGWITGLIIMLTGVVLCFVSGLPAGFDVSELSLLSMAALLLSIYGLTYLIVCLVARKRVGMPVRISFWRVAGKRTKKSFFLGKFQIGFIFLALISATCVPVLLSWWWRGSVDLKAQRDLEWLNRIKFVQASEEPIFEAAKRAVKEQLVSPASAKFETMAEIIHNENDDHARVMLEVESQDEKGSAIRSRWQVELQRQKQDKAAQWRAQSVKMIESSAK